MGKCRLEIYKRITGFFRPTKVWNPGKKAEGEDRVTYNFTTKKKKDKTKDKKKDKTNKDYNMMDREYPPIMKDGFK